jgi:hypothetical protein
MLGRIGRAGLVSLVSSLAVVGLNTAAPPAAAAVKNTPLGQVLIVSNNVYETTGRDIRSTRDMRNFVDKAVELPHKIPDIVLLQEVSARSVAVIRTLISRRTGQHYVTVVNAGRRVWRPLSGNRMLGSDTAIIMNSKTMKAGDKGSMRHPYRRSQAAGGIGVKVKKTVFAMVAERGSEAEGALKVPVASVHFPRTGQFRSTRVSLNLKEKWVRQIADKLSHKWPGGENKRTIGGDFNHFRCRYRFSLNCTQTPPYNMLTRKKGYKDTVFRMQGGGNPLDFIFSASNIVKSNWHRWQPNSGKGYYSNHDLRFALIEGPDTTSPTRPGRIRFKSGYPRHIHFGFWDRSRDGGSGFRRFEIYRAHGRDSTDWHMIRTTREHHQKIKDYDNIVPHDWYRYKVRAVDRVDRFSETPVIEVKAE